MVPIAFRRTPCAGAAHGAAKRGRDDRAHLSEQRDEQPSSPIPELSSLSIPND